MKPPGKIQQWLTFWTTVREELNWAKMASTATLTALTRAGRRNKSLQLNSKELQLHQRQTCTAGQGNTHTDVHPHLSFPAGTERTGQDLSLDASHLRPSRMSLLSVQFQRMTHCEQLTAAVKEEWLTTIKKKCKFNRSKTNHNREKYHNSNICVISGSN